MIERFWCSGIMMRPSMPEYRHPCCKIGTYKAHDGKFYCLEHYAMEEVKPGLFNRLREEGFSVEMTKEELQEYRSKYINITDEDLESEW